jgi:hypothetical protein
VEQTIKHNQNDYIEEDGKVDTLEGNCVRFEVFTAVTMKYGVFWDVTPCGFYKNRRFGGS